MSEQYERKSILMRNNNLSFCQLNSNPFASVRQIAKAFHTHFRHSHNQRLNIKLMQISSESSQQNAY